MFRNIVHIASSVMRFIITRRVGLCFALVLLYASEEIKAQTNEWTWQGGTSINPVTCSSNNNLFCYQPGVYGTEGVPALGNIPSSRGEAATATDSKGNFWLFGGSDFEGQFNDLWKFDDSIQEWVWLNGSNTGTTPGVWGTLGVPAAGNIPSPRSNGVGWIDANGNFWLFGGSGEDSTGSGGGGDLNDLWEYSPSTNEWTWESGSNIAGASGVYGTMGTPSTSNTPGARDGSVSWVDSSGNLWLFGGEVNDSVSNDLWMFNPTTKAWTWESGGSTAGASGVYGTLGVAAPNNVPGARFGAVSWIDKNDNLWLFGGTSIVSTGAVYLNDLWHYSPTSKEWAWMNGSSTTNASAVYGILGVASSSTTPGAYTQQTANPSWSDSSGDFWLFDGNVWEFNPAADQWTWVSENGTAVAYGTKGTASTSNWPGGRSGAACWVDNNGNFWLFGSGYRNDLWRYQP